MRQSIRITAIVAAIVIISWWSFCLGYKTAFLAGEKRNAALVYHTTNLVCAVVKNIDNKNVRKAKKILVEQINLNRLYIDTTRITIHAFSVLGLILNPKKTFREISYDANEAMPTTKQIDCDL